MSLEQDLARLLWAYEIDEPHVGEFADSGQYPVPAWSDIEGCLAMDHCGDCVNLPAACPRCVAEHVWHKAGWIADRLRTVR